MTSETQLQLVSQADDPEVRSSQQRKGAVQAAGASDRLIEMLITHLLLSP